MLTGALIVLFLLLLLAVPITLAFHVSTQEALQNDIELRWAFGLLRWRIHSADSTEPAEPPATPDRESKREARRTRKNRNMVAMLRNSRFRRRLGRFVADLWRAIHKEDVSVHFRVGLGDPADTGRLWAALGPLAGILSAIRDASINIEPEFFDTTLDVSSSGRVRVIPLQLAYLATGLMLSPVVWQAMRQGRSGT